MRAPKTRHSSVSASGPVPPSVSIASTHLECVADRHAERLVHVGHQALDALSERLTHASEFVREHARVGLGLHERARTHLHVEHDGVCAARDLLADDGADDERNRRDRSRHVSQGIHLLVSGVDVGRLRDHGDADAGDLSEEVVRSKLDTETGNGLELVERAAGVAQSPPAHLRNGHSARSHKRCKHERGGVRDAAGRVLVDLDAGNRRQVDDAARANHGVGERDGLLGGKSAQVGGHEPRRHLVVGELPRRIAENDAVDLLGSVLVPVALALDELLERRLSTHALRTSERNDVPRLHVPGIP